VLAVLYTIPAVGGYEIDCGPLERNICEAAWQEVKHEPIEGLGFLTFVPITGVTVRDASNDAPSCGTWTIHRFGILDVTMHRDCL
jgi:hypothetical protein